MGRFFCCCFFLLLINHQIFSGLENTAQSSCQNEFYTLYGKKSLLHILFTFLSHYHWTNFLPCKIIDKKGIWNLSSQTHHSVLSPVTQVFESFHHPSAPSESSLSILPLVPSGVPLDLGYVRLSSVTKVLTVPPPHTIITGKTSSPQISSCSHTQTHAYTCMIHKGIPAPPCNLPLACKAFINT